MPKKEEETWFQKDSRESIEKLIEELAPEAQKQLAALLNNEKFVHLIGLYKPQIPGIHLFATKLEYDHFPPGTSSNDDFNFALLEQENIIWSIISVPKTALNTVKKLANDCNLPLTHSIPDTFGVGGASQIPITNEDVYFLGEISGRVLYSTPQKGIKETLAKENLEIEKMFKEREQKIKQSK